MISPNLLADAALRNSHGLATLDHEESENGLIRLTLTEAALGASASIALSPPIDRWCCAVRIDALGTKPHLNNSSARVRPHSSVQVPVLQDHRAARKALASARRRPQLEFPLPRQSRR